MKELVCMAPDGSLEVWRKCKIRTIKWAELGYSWVWQFDAELIPESLFGIDMDRFLMPNFKKKHGPKFWGREVLSDL